MIPFTDYIRYDGLGLAALVKRGEVSAAELLETAIGRIEALNPALNAVIRKRYEAARAEASQVDRGAPFAGVPYLLKDLLATLAGEPTACGNRLLARLPMPHDSELVRRLRAAGLVIAGRTNTPEFGLTPYTEPLLHGPTRNPWSTAHSPGGSSGGSAAAVAAGQVPLSLGSDTNGSIRVPSSLCGVFGLKPTFGRLPRVGSYPFVASLDHLGPFARSAHDLALAYDSMQGPLHGPPSDDPACAQRPGQPTLQLLDQGAQGLRIGVLGGWFREMALPEATDAVDTVAQALGTTRLIELPEVERARAAAFLITCGEGGALHLEDLKKRAADFDPMTRDRFLANALMPAAWVIQAQRVRHWFARRVARVFENVDVLLAPATPCVAPIIGTEWLQIGERRLPSRASMGLLTQPISCIGLPVVAVPLWGMSAAQPHLPIGVQLIAAPWREDHALRVAAQLQAQGLCSAPVARGL